MSREHHYSLELTWTGNTGFGTASHRGYSRDHDITADGPGTLPGTADPAFRGTQDRWNPEQLFIAAVAQCHLLTYLWLCAGAGVVVTDYRDSPTGVMLEEADGSGQFTSITLHPKVTIATTSDPVLARDLHQRVGSYCFIARSVNVPIHHEPKVGFDPAD